MVGIVMELIDPYYLSYLDYLQFYQERHLELHISKLIATTKSRGFSLLQTCNKKTIRRSQIAFYQKQSINGERLIENFLFLTQ